MERAPAQERRESSTKNANVEINDAILPPDCKGLLNRKAIHLTALKLANERFPATEGRPPKFCRVSQKFIDALEQVIRRELVEAIERHPSPLLTNTVKEF